jgi:hypothetical protein
MKSYSSLFFAGLCALLLAPAGTAVAQGSSPIDFEVPRASVLVGPVVGVNRNFHTGGFRTITADESCPMFEKGSGWGFLAGITAELLLGEKWSLIPRLTYESRPGSFTSELPDALVLIPGQNGQQNQIVTQTVTAASEVTYSLINMELMYKQEVADLGGMRIGVAAGPAFGIVIGGNNRQVQDLVEPQNARFTNPQGFPTENSGRRIIFFDGAIPERSGMRLSLKAGLQAEVGLFGNAWIMTPGLYYDYGLTDVTGAENWQLNTLMFMVDFRRAF